jgi:2-polyprenyl-3-methyl-5-hydroxy-6-metoxy-1,4-benzoquinol methylase
MPFTFTGAAAAKPGAHHACTLCHSTESQLIATKDRDGRPLPTVICLHCGLVRTDPMPAPAEIEEYYAHHYRQSYKGGWQPAPKRVYRAALVAADRWRRLEPFLRDSRQVLDVGASSGEFVYMLQSQGKAALGIEPNEAYAHWAREELQLPVLTADWRGADFAESSFEAITLFHVLEHLADPCGALTRLARWLSPDGVLVVEVPNVESPVGSPQRRFHYAHLHNFNPATLRQAGLCAGLVLRHEEVSPDGGNLTAVFTRGAVLRPQRCGGLPGNAERVLAVLRRRGRWDYALSRSTWRRLQDKVVRGLIEGRTVRRLRAPREILAAATTGGG